jgi:GntR family transcriptional regulator, transcriptional repressor for pyruvate dehydrogenase complex
MTVSGDVTQQIRLLIADRELGRGDRLPSERDLAVTLGVSRPALREGLRRLVDVGVLEPRRGSGTYVAGADPGELIEVRDRLEPHAARLAARNHTAIDAAAFTRILEDLRAGSSSAYVELRMAIATASGNAVLASLIASLAELEPRPSRVTNRLIKDMTRVAERVIDRDGSGARQAMRRHLQRAARRAD